MIKSFVVCGSGYLLFVKLATAGESQQGHPIDPKNTTKLRHFPRIFCVHFSYSK